MRTPKSIQILWFEPSFPKIFHMKKDHFPLFVAGDHKASPGSQVHVLAEFQNEAGVNLVDD
jgi:hypothetical protein